MPGRGDSHPEAGRTAWPLRALRYALKLLAWCAAVLGALLGIAWLLLVSFFPDDEICELVLEEVESRTGMQIRVGDVALSPLQGLVLDAVKLEPPKGFDDPPLELEQLVLVYSPADLLDDRLQVRALRAKRPRIRIRIDAQGRSNLQALLEGLPPSEASEPAEPAAEKPGLELALESISLEKAGLSVDLPGLQVELEDLDLDLRGRIGGQAASQLALALRIPVPAGGGNVSLRAGGLQATASAGLSIDASLLDFERLALRGRCRLARVRAEGLGAEHELEIDFTGGADLGAGTAELTSLQAVLDGQLLCAARAEVSGLDAQPRYSVHVERAAVGLEGFGSLLQQLTGLHPSGRIRLEEVELAGEPGALPRAGGKLALEKIGLAGRGLQIRGLDAGLGIAFEPEQDGGRLGVKGRLDAQRAGTGGLSAGPLALGLDLGATLSELSGALSVQKPSIAIHLESAAISGVGLALSGAGLDLELEGPRIDLAQPLPVDAARLHLRASASELEAFGLQLAGVELQARVAGSGIDPLRPQLASLRVGCTASARKLHAAVLSASGAEVELALKGSGLSRTQRFARPLALELTVGAEGIDAAAAGLRVRAPKAKLTTRVDSARAGVLPLRIAVDAAGGRIALDAGPPASSTADAPPIELVAPGAVHLEARGRVSPGRSKVEIDDALLGIGELLGLSAKGSLDWRASECDLSFETQPHRIERVVAAVPAELRGFTPPLSGEVQISGSYRGQLPRAFEPRRFLEPGSPRVELRVRHKGLSLDWPERGLRLENLSGPVRLAAGGERGGLEAELHQSAAGLSLAGPGLAARGLSAALASHYDGELLRADGRLGVARLDPGEHWPEGLTDVALVYAAQLQESKELRLNELRLDLPSAGLSVQAHGQVVRPPGAEAWTEMRVALQTDADFESARPVPLPGAVRLRGKAGVRLQVRSRSPGTIAALGRLSAEGLSAAGPGFALEGVQGVVPVDQLVAISPRPGLLAASAEGREEEGDAGHRSRSSAYEEALRPLKGQQRSFRIQRVAFKDLEIVDLSGKLDLAAGTLSLGSLRLGFLHGDVLADTVLTLAPPGTRRLRLDAEMSGVDLSGLGALSLTGSSDISGNFRLTVDWGQKDFSSSVDLTQIGSSTLQALLVAIDPGETNPGVMKLRRFLSEYKVSPRRVSLVVRHGLAGMRSEFDMGLAARTAAGFLDGFQGDTFQISHLPVGSILSKYLGF
ncbi:MAG: AsmA family protein [Deltaproteobacteria bacterium]|nr:AsmA family protein [Deltaproteobacteria bacterium]